MIRLAVLALAVLLAADAAAYVPGARSIFRRFSERQAGDQVKSGDLVGRAVAPDGSGGARVASVRASVTFPGACRIRLEHADASEQAAFDPKAGLTTEGTPPAALTALAELGCPLATLKGVPASEAEARVAKVAQELGIDTKVVSLSLLGTRPAYVVGAKPRDLSRPQLWIDKETHRLIRVVGRHGGAMWDVRFQNPASVATAHRLARVVEVYRGPERQLGMRLMSAEGGAAAGEGGEPVIEDAE